MISKEEITEGLGAGFSSGLGGGVLAHFWGGGKMTFPIRSAFYKLFKVLYFNV